MSSSFATSHTLCFCVLSVGSVLTCGWVWGSKLQRIAQHIIVVPDIKLVVSRVVVHRGNILIGVGERDVDRLLAGVVGIVGIHHQVTACFAVIVLVDGPYCVKHTTRHEGVGCHPLVEAGLPGAFKAQRVRVHLWTKRKCWTWLKINLKTIILGSLKRLFGFGGIYFSVGGVIKVKCIQDLKSNSTCHWFLDINFYFKVQFEGMLKVSLGFLTVA